MQINLQAYQKHHVNSELCGIMTFTMNTITEILKYTLPSLVVMATTWILVRSYLQHDRQSNELALKPELQKASLPVRMQAYERLVLLLERLQPAGLILRTNIQGMNAASLHAALLQAVREEFDHNLSQQLYVSPEAWALVKKSREQTIQLINSAAAQTGPDSSTADLAEKILVRDIESTLPGIDEAINFLKKEAKESFF